MDKAIAEIECVTAEELLASLNRANPLWGGTRHLWVFRGHADDERYSLVPSALRATPQASLGYTFSPKVGLQATNAEQIDAEFERLHEFFWSIDAQGLPVPGDGEFLRTPSGWQAMKDRIASHGWPIDALLPLAALAQHYGVPTRLLDWSDRPLVAAFFAAKGAAKRKESKSSKDSKAMSVWALNLDWIIHSAFPGAGGVNLPVYVVTAPRASNPNLHAQGGVFTTESLSANELSAPTSARPLDELVSEKWKSLAHNTPVMAHIRLPASESGALLRLLNQEQVNSATVFPGYQGAADSLDERKWWDTPERASYWMEGNPITKP